MFAVSDVREPVTAKTGGDARPLCYCFGFTEGDIRRELARAGETRIPSRIGRLIKEKLCACEVRNPSGACCLGEVNRSVKRLLAGEGIEASHGGQYANSACRRSPQAVGNKRPAAGDSLFDSAGCPLVLMRS
jgi:hypothetical protein